MFSDDGLVSFYLCSGVDLSLVALYGCKGGITERRLDRVIDGEVDGPRRKVSQDGRTEATIEATNTFVLGDILYGVWKIPPSVSTKVASS
jgi:hypothetical protein